MSPKRKIKIRRTFYSGFVIGSIFTLVLVLFIQGWDMYRQSWMDQRAKIENEQDSRAHDRVAGAKAPEPMTDFNDLEGKPTQGPSKAPVTIVEFSDFHCPYCKRLSAALSRLGEEQEGKIKIVWRHFPLTIHEFAIKSHQASECAAEQGKFWAFHDAFYDLKETPRDIAVLEALGKKIGVNRKQFKACLESNKYEDVVQSDIAKGKEIGVRGTPTIFINGKRFIGARPYENLAYIVRKEIEKASG